MSKALPAGLARGAAGVRGGWMTSAAVDKEVNNPYFSLLKSTPRTQHTYGRDGREQEQKV